MQGAHVDFLPQLFVFHIRKVLGCEEFFFLTSFSHSIWFPGILFDINWYFLFRISTLSSAEASKETETKKTGRAGDHEKGFLPSSQRSPRAHHSLSQSFNIFIALQPPLKDPREPLRKREAFYCALKELFFKSVCFACVPTSPITFLMLHP